MNAPYKDERRLKKDLSEGLLASYRFVINTYYDPLLKYATRLFLEEAPAKDLVQECFIKLWEQREKAITIVSLKNYLYRSVYNGFIDQKRKNKGHIPFEEIHAGLLLEYNEAFSSESIQEQLKLLNEEIEKLPPRCKETFLLNKKEGLNHAEISSYMGVSVRTVEAQIIKAYRILRAKLDF